MRRLLITGVSAGVVGMALATSQLLPVHSAHAMRMASGTAQILKDSYAPAAITAKVGDTVTWTNVDTTPGNGHTVTSTGRGPLRSPSLSQGGTFSHTFTTAGSYPYYCAIHPDMTGTVTVQ